MTVFVTLDIELKPEAADAFCDGFQQMLEDTVKFRGFRYIRVVRHTENPNRVFLFEEWDSVADYETYIAFRTERGDMDMLGQIAVSSKLDYWPTLVATAEV